MPIFAYVPRKQQQPQGGVISYGARNVRPVEGIYPHQSPDPIRQGDTPARPARMPITNMATFRMSNSGIAGTFIPYLHALMPVHAPNNPGQKRLVGHSGIGSERTNIRKPSAIAYGSLFELERGY